MTEEFAGYCTLCRSRCGTLNDVEDGRLVAVRPLPGHPTGSALCAKGRAAPEIAHSSRRLTRPLRRTNPKGAADPGWIAISWDEALATIAERIGAIREKDGAEAVAFAVTSPSATPIVDSVDWVMRFVHLFGSPNLCTATEICNWQKDVAHAFTFGVPMPLPDYEETDLVILWGHNPGSVWLAEAGALGEALRCGARLVVVDPRPTAHTREAAHWLAVRPGTDAALALGLAHLLIESGRFDAAFVREWTNGPALVRADTGAFARDPEGRLLVLRDGIPEPLDPAADPTGTDAALFGEATVDGVRCEPAFALFARRAASFPPERVEAITGIPAASVRAVADAIASARSVSQYAWTGVGQHGNSTQTARAIATLYALTGHFDRPGGNRVAEGVPAGAIAGPGLLSEAQRAKALGAGTRPIGPAALGMVTAREIYDAVLDARPYKVRALVTFGANLLLSRADVDRGLDALRALDFAVHCDLFETPTGREADILLPVSSPWEREGLRIGFDFAAPGTEWVQLRQAMIPRQGEARSDAEIVLALADRLGFGGEMFGGDIEAGWRHQLAPLGLSLDALRAVPEGIAIPAPRRARKYAERDAGGAVRGFATESGRVEIYSELFLRHGEDPLPVFTPPEGDGPFVLGSAKSGYYCQSQHRHVASLRRRAPEPAITLAADIAAARGIADGDAVEVATRTGKARFTARIEPRMAAGAAIAEFGWWQADPDLGLSGYDPIRDEGSNFNRLVDSAGADPVSGAPALKSFPCDIHRIPATVPPWPGTLVIAAREVHGDTVSLHLARPDGAPLPPFRPGAYIALAADIDGEGAVERCYSLAGASGPDGVATYRIAVRRVGDGRLSRWLTTRAAVGDRLAAKPPAGRFLLPVEADFPVVLLAAGIGITPFLAHLEALRRSPRPAETVLHYGYRTPADRIFGAEIDAARATASLRIVEHLSRPGEADLASMGDARAGRLDAASVDQHLIDRRARFYICGPGAMIEEIRAGLIARGVPRFEIFSEVFRSSGALAAPPSAGPHRVHFVRTGRSAVWTAADGDLLAFGEAHGVALPSGCRVGQCESCAVTLLEGEVRHVAPVAELDDGVCLSCCAVPAGDIVLDA
ncbi:molybdopterin-dependent oxidoreductase [Acuticoccus kandeliae]|uniref:molybdopterin-dependent oxidoreductase n=1 Tax=Acuticoccus kandeliae TaxID=2073160 RepID=UPI000D3E91DC|nr:molybdopterin-dependent oxidoreductase [Acuticoccus kandeliae]